MFVFESVATLFVLKRARSDKLVRDRGKFRKVAKPLPKFLIQPSENRLR